MILMSAHDTCKIDLALQVEQQCGCMWGIFDSKSHTGVNIKSIPAVVKVLNWSETNVNGRCALQMSLLLRIDQP